MDVLSVSSPTPTTLTAVNPLWSAKLTADQNTNTLTFKDLAKELFQHTLLSTPLPPLPDSTLGASRLAQLATSTLMASLSAPQATATTSPTSDASSTAAIVNPVASTGPVGITASTVPSTPLPTPVVKDLAAVQDTFTNSSTGDFAMQTALRFGAGVLGPAAPALASSQQGTGLVRDATAVLRTATVQAHGGGPGPEAFFHTQTNAARILREYQTVSPPLQPVGLDLLA